MRAETRGQETEECTRAAARLVLEQGDGVSATARRLRIHAQRAGRWQRECATHGSAAFPGQGRLATAQEAWPRWRRERELCTKALGCFARGAH